MTDQAALTVIAVAVSLMGLLALAGIVALAVVVIQLVRLERTIARRVAALEGEVRTALGRVTRLRGAVPAAGQWVALATAILQLLARRPRPPAREVPWWQQALSLAYGLWQVSRPKAPAPGSARGQQKGGRS